jgi:hypothetical protein
MKLDNTGADSRLLLRGFRSIEREFDHESFPGCGALFQDDLTKLDMAGEFRESGRSDHE